MATSESGPSPSRDNLGNIRRFNGLRKILERSGPFCKPNFSPTPDNLEFLQTTCKILVIGAGGLGCELLKDLAMMGYGDLHVIDMDTVELSNLNRQFLFRRSDIGLSKAECAAKFINARVPTCHVTPHFAKIQDYDEIFYQQFHIIVCGLDSVVARRWINGMLISMISYDDDGTPDLSSLIPMVDGGTEGFKGNARVILPCLTACIECTLNLFPPQVTYPLCTLANTPRLPEHCIEYVKVIQWDKENPFKAALDGDDPQHVSWIHERALERANKYNISGVTYKLVQGVIKNIIPAVASTNAIIAAACANEVFKLTTNCYDGLNNYLNFNDLDGIYTYIFQAEKLDNCLACSNVPYMLKIDRPKTTTLGEVIKMLCNSRRLQMKRPALTTFLNGRNKTLYMSSVRSIEERTRINLLMSLTELNLCDGQKIMVADETSPNPITVQLQFSTEEDETTEPQ